MPDLLPYAAHKLRELQDSFRVPNQRVDPPCPSMAEYEARCKQMDTVKRCQEALDTLTAGLEELGYFASTFEQVADILENLK